MAEIKINDSAFYLGGIDGKTWTEVSSMTNVGNINEKFTKIDTTNIKSTHKQSARGIGEYSDFTVTFNVDDVNLDKVIAACGIENSKFKIVLPNKANFVLTGYSEYNLKGGKVNGLYSLELKIVVNDSVKGKETTV